MDSVKIHMASTLAGFILDACFGDRSSEGEGVVLRASFRAVPACGLGRDTESLSGSRNELLTRFRADGRKTDGMQDS